MREFFREAAMTSSIKISLRHPFVAIADTLSVAKLPDDWPTESGNATTSTCILFGCESADPDDDDIRFTIGLEHHLHTNGRPILDHVLETPQGRVGIWTTEFRKLLEQKVPTTRTRVRIWGNRLKDPDDVVIGLSEAD
jgi:hypothetical protein